MRTSRKLGAAVGGLALIATAFVGSGTANANLADCDSGNFCAWTEDGFTGRIAEWSTNSTQWLGRNMHDDADSVFNNGKPVTLDSVNVYEDINYGDFDICVDRGETYDTAMDDNDYDSHKWVDHC